MIGLLFQIYITFPLDAFAGKLSLNAYPLPIRPIGALTADAQLLIQVSEVAQDWNRPLTWNNGPLVLENVSQVWAGVIGQTEWECRLLGCKR
jgi:hypothetical protein